MAWERARVDERCGSCNDLIAAGGAVYAFYVGGLRGTRKVRCPRCAASFTDTRPGEELSEDTTAPQPSFVPVERLPNVVSHGYLQARREAALARLDRWRRRHGHASR